eukprot:TRINITY_DN24588_c0_g5_i1.p1 TRINITY_DN24588_c0_g5~~TRINITY_DN24588_c0_g5_i1.p1  ORF type:complete len:280 (+),score=47.98 TRINITY_DN24588_c0_g5_i1:55-894(+)
MGSASSAEAIAAFKKADTDGDGKLTPQEIHSMIESYPQLWNMLQVNTNLSAEICKATAAKVMEAKCDANKDGLVTQKEFGVVYDALFKKPRNQLDFFHQALFAAFDADGNGRMDKAELSKFLDLFYEKGSIFAGDHRLPEKHVLESRVLRELDTDSDGKLSFAEIKPLLTGSFALEGGKAAAQEETPVSKHIEPQQVNADRTDKVAAPAMTQAPQPRADASVGSPKAQPQGGAGSLVTADEGIVAEKPANSVLQSILNFVTCNRRRRPNSGEAPPVLDP